MDVLRPAATLTALALALAGCGDSREEKRVKELKAVCDGAVGRTVADLEATYQIGIRLAECGTPAQVGALGCTGTADLCILGFWFQPTTDPAVCEPTGCAFWCEVRATLDDLRAHDDDHAAQVCGSDWVDGQPDPGVFWYYPYWQPGHLP